MKELEMHERIALANQSAKGYGKLTKEEKSAVLDDFCEKTGHNRKYASTLLSNWNKEKLVRIDGKLCRLKPQRKKPKRIVREPYYGKEEQELLIRLWELYDFPCGKRMIGVLKRDLQGFKNKELFYGYGAETWDRLGRISAATIDRVLIGEKKKYRIKSRGRTKTGTHLKHHIPIRTFADWDEDESGFFEGDLVSHDGGAARGDYSYTLTLCDVKSGWTELYGLMNKAQTWTVKGLDTLRGRCPFKLKGIDTDNGSEFINTHFVKYCEENNITFTRSRPYRKNDNCHVEQKNGAVVRRFIGHFRIEGEEQTALLNEIYQYLRLYINFFQPQMRLKEKTRTGTKITRKYDEPLTPYDRLLQDRRIDSETKKRLRAMYRKINILQLKGKIDNLAAKLQYQSMKNMPAQKDSQEIFRLDFLDEATTLK